jgi:LEA14-like dessication related protein
MNVNPANLRALMRYFMEKKTLSKWFILCGSLCLALCCQKPMLPEYLGFSNPQFDKTNLQNSQISANLKFYNPNGFGLKLKRVDMDISLNDKLANHYLLDSTIIIPKRDTFFIPLSIRLDLKNLLSNALQVFISRQVKITLDGKIKLKRGILPATRHFHYEVNQPLDSLIKLGN